MSDRPGVGEEPEFTAPQRSLVVRELRALRELPRLAWHGRDLSRAPRGAAGVMVLPGFSTNDTAMTPLTAFLRSRGHTVWGWGLGTNRGDVANVLPSVIEQVEERQRLWGSPVSLVGWSLGGVFAREVARDRPDLVDQVITMATPIYGGPRYTVGADSYTADELDEIEAQIDERNPRLIHQPITVFYTRKDGAVDWRTCIDDINPNAEMIEVDSSHLGITLDPTVWLQIASRLATE